jgi:RNA polymerase sigma factor (TIGR02999 family)
LSQIEAGDPSATEQLLPLVYEELRKLAAARLAQEKPGHLLQATALVHDAYLRLVDSGQAQHWNSRGHFFGAAAEAMRRILVDNARRRTSQKRGGGQERVALINRPAPDTGDQVDLLAIDEALEKLEIEHPDKARLVKLRFFAGCSLDDAAELLGLSRATTQRHWAFARAWLFGKLNSY